MSVSTKPLLANNKQNIADQRILLQIIFAQLAASDLISWSQAGGLRREVFRAVDIWQLTGRTSDKHLQLAIFIEYYKDLPPQGSEAWKKSRSAIGGSEIGTILKINPYQRIRELIATKVGISEFSGSLATRWGNLFEEALFGVVDQLFQCSTVETGSIPGLCAANGAVLTSYSPDRLGVLRANVWKDVLGDLSPFIKSSRGAIPCPRESEFLVLFEGKCPLSRIPDNEIPPQYGAQPLAGACTIPITDICLFVDGMFRRCSIEQFGPTAEFIPTNGAKNASISHLPLVAGFIGIYEVTDKKIEDNQRESLTPQKRAEFLQKLKNELTRFDYSIYKVLNLIVHLDKCLDVWTQRSGELTHSDRAELIRMTIHMYNEAPLVHEFLQLLEPLKPLAAGRDYGTLSEIELGTLLRNVIENRHSEAPGTLKAYYPEAFYTIDSAWQKHFPVEHSQYWEPMPRTWLIRNINKFILWCRKKGYTYKGILPWKLFKCSLIPVPKDPGFLEAQRTKIEAVLQQIAFVRAAADPVAALDELFPRRTAKKIAPTNDHFSQDTLDSFADLGTN